MSAHFQTAAALALVAIAAAWLAFRVLKKRKSPGCGDNCGAISPEMKRLQAKLRK